ncbi:MAG: hypothetical protein EPO23_00535 [Xanthobacteraceae bacterium]|nr:MAG: hypothetical protein EPO23_00535 [Xanthobacteraceae bacterium]
MNWSELAADVIGLGAPRLGAALAGPLGEAAGRLLAEILAVPARAPDDVKAVLADADASRLAEADQKWAELIRAEAETQRAAIAETHQTIRTELASEDPLQRWWRPGYAIELTLECAALWSVVIGQLWSGDVRALNALIGGTALLVAYWGFRFGVLGVYVSGRTREKLTAATGEPVPGGLGQVASAIRKRR